MVAERGGELANAEQQFLQHPERDDFASGYLGQQGCNQHGGAGGSESGPPSHGSGCNRCGDDGEDGADEGCEGAVE
ncbi:hypothetical protein MASR2M8_17240 [Opitutaceae bacterium]